MQNSKIQQKVRISVAVVFYNPTFDELQQTMCNIKKLISLTAFQFDFYLIDNGSPQKKIDRKIFSEVLDSVNFIDLKTNRGFGKGHNIVRLYNFKY